MKLAVKDSIDKRRYPRLHEDIPAQITILDSSYPALCRNISEGGVFLEVDADFLRSNIRELKPNNGSYKLELQLDREQEKVDTDVSIRWNSGLSQPEINKYGFGMEFTSLVPVSKNRITDFVRNRLYHPESPLFLKNYNLIIGGEEVDTGEYRYFPYMEKLLLEPEKTKYILDIVRRGKVVPGYDKYIYGRYCFGNGDINHQAVLAAYQASKIYRNFHLDTRAKIINDIHKLLIEKKEDYIALLAVEGHSRRLAEWEIGGMLTGTSPETVGFYKSNIEREIGCSGNESIGWIRKPDGVVCLATPKNAPSSISVIGVFALLAGNTMVIKPPLSIPLSTIYFWNDIVNKALAMNHAPAGTVNIVIGNANYIMKEWISSPYVNSIIYIGSSRRGLDLGKQIYAAGKKPILELSGNDVMAVWKDAPVEEATDAVLDSFLGSTQICMVPKLALIHEEIFPAFKERLLKKVINVRAGLPSNPDTCLVPVGKIKEFFITLKDALNKGAKLLHGGQTVDWQGRLDPKGRFIQPTVISINESPYLESMLCIKEEIFFPLLPLIVVSGASDEEVWNKMLKFINSNDYGLRVSAWTRSSNCANRFIQEVHNTGILRINSPHVNFSHYLANNGGVRKSGGPFGEMSYIWQKTSHLQGYSVSYLDRK